MAKQFLQISLTILIFCYLLSYNLQAQQPSLHNINPANYAQDGNWGMIAFPHFNSNGNLMIYNNADPRNK
ncbi:MAG: hypothetical protein ABSG15_04340 [FCB group bacterium]|jgi:hypothetical protein